MATRVSLLLVLLVVALCGGPVQAQPAQENVRIAWLANDPANTYDQAIGDGIMQMARRAGGTVTPFYAGFDPATQLAQCQDAVASGDFDALILMAASPTESIPCVDLAAAAGIPVAGADLVIGPDQTTVHPQVRGQVAASFIPASRFGDGVAALMPDLCAGLSACNVLYVAGLESFPLDAYGLAAVSAAAQSLPSVRLVAHTEAFYDTAVAREVVGEALDRYPEINVVIASGDQMALGAEQAAHERARPLRIVGAGAGTSALAAVRDGRWFATFNALPRSEGIIVTHLLLRALAAPTVPVGVDPVAVSGLPNWWTQATLAAHPTFTGQWPGP
jgi:ribose transport system substrate-binding protein